MEKILLKNINNKNSQSIDSYLNAGGYTGLKKALTMQPDDVVAEVKTAKLVGRGGAAFPTSMKWEFIRKENPEPRYLICNADEGEPGTFKDRVIIEKDPHLLIEGMIIAGYAIGAKKGYLYIRGEYFDGIEILEKAVAEAKAKNLLGERILGTDFNFDIVVYVGAGAYVCGEETSLFESIEGDRALPRWKPPFPTHAGVFKKPTVINNVETLANVPAILEKGGEWFSKIGSADNPGTKLYCVSGFVNKPGVYELPMNITLGELIDNYAGGVKGEFLAALPGGVSSSFVDDLNIIMDYKHIADAGSMLGSAAIIVLNKQTDLLKACINIMDFFAEESCGRCTTCRVSNQQMRNILEKLLRNEAVEGDIETLLEIADISKKTALCGLGQAAPSCVTSSYAHFREVYHSHIKAV